MGDHSQDLIAKSGGQPSLTSREARFVYGIVLFQGFGLLISWNAILNVIPYFQDMYGESSTSFYLTSAYVYPQLPVLLLVTLYGHKVPFTLRICFSLTVMTVLMALLPALAPLGMWYSLTLMFINGVATAILQPSMMGFTSMFPPAYNQAVMFGQGVSGVVACVANIVVQAALPNSVDASAKVYFGASAASIAACLLTFLYILRLDFTQYFVRKAMGHSSGSSNSDGDSDVSGGSPAAAAATIGDSDDDLALELETGAESEERGLVSSSNNHDGPAPSQVSKLAVLKKVWLMAVTVWLVFTMTFMVFPGVAPYSIDFKNSWGSLHISNNWWGIVLLTVFNCFDTIGRFLPSKVQLLKGKPLFAASVLRLLLLPAFMGAALRWAGWMDDTYAFVVMAVFSITNGYFASLAMMQGPMGVASTEREAAGFVLALFLQFGIFTGSQIAMGLERVV